MDRGLSTLQRTILEALELLPPEEARPKGIMAVLDRDSTNANRAAVSKALRRLIERGLVEKGSTLSDTEFLEVMREAEQREEAKAFSLRRAQDVLAGMETPPEREARIKAGLKARWAQVKAQALATIARVEAAEWNQKRNPPPQSLLSRLIQRYSAAKTTAERRQIRMAIQAELRKDNPSPRGGTIYKMRNDAVTPYQRYQNATTAAEKREAFKAMAALYRKEHGRDDDER